MPDTQPVRTVPRQRLTINGVRRSARYRVRMTPEPTGGLLLEALDGQSQVVETLSDATIEDAGKRITATNGTDTWVMEAGCGCGK